MKEKVQTFITIDIFCYFYWRNNPTFYKLSHFTIRIVFENNIFLVLSMEGFIFILKQLSIKENLFGGNTFAATLHTLFSLSSNYSNTF